MCRAAVAAILLGSLLAPSATGSARETIHDVSSAPYLPTAPDFTGASIKDTRLSAAAYALTKLIGSPTMMAVACWSDVDWNAMGEGGSDGGYSTLAFWSPDMPHWVHLSPDICRSMETLLRHRPLYPNVFTSDAVETLTHELMHAIGYGKEARAECYGMQLSAFLAVRLGVPMKYALGLARLNLANYAAEPPSYVDKARCREDGVWDLFPGQPSPPWHAAAFG